MAGLITTLGKKILINRGYTAVPDYAIPSQFKVGTGTTAPAVGDTDTEQSIPIGNGTVNDDGSNTLTGSNGGDNSTSNTTTYKPGAGLSDVTAQNLIANNGNATKTWAISDLSSAGTVCAAAQFTSLWIYIINDTAKDKLKTAGTAIEVKLGSDSSNYYSKTFAVSTLSTGWNSLDLGVLNTNTETGTVGTPIDYFEIVATTNNTTDTFVAGDFIYDLLRQYESTDLLKVFDSLTINESTLKTTIVCELLSGEAVGYDLTEIGTFNADATPKLAGRDTYTAQSKSSADEFKFTIIEVIQ
jgi:hypothetical protein